MAALVRALISGVVLFVSGIIGLVVLAAGVVYLVALGIVVFDELFALASVLILHDKNALDGLLMFTAIGCVGFVPIALALRLHSRTQDAPFTRPLSLERDRR